MAGSDSKVMREKCVTGRSCGHATTCDMRNSTMQLVVTLQGKFAERPLKKEGSQALSTEQVKGKAKRESHL